VDGLILLRFLYGLGGDTLFIILPSQKQNVRADLKSFLGIINRKKEPTILCFCGQQQQHIEPWINLTITI